MSAIIETQGLSKTYGHFGAVHEVAISVPQGSVFAMMGRAAPEKRQLSKFFSI